MIKMQLLIAVFNSRSTMCLFWSLNSVYKALTSTLSIFPSTQIVLGCKYSRLINYQNGFNSKIGVFVDELFEMT